MLSINSVGKETICYCGSCKLDLAHLIVAMVGDRIVKVECKTCRKSHQYRPPKGATDPTQAKARSPRVRAQIRSIEEEWQERLQQVKTKPSKPYSIKTSLQVGDVVAHPTFGEGVVEKLIHPNKFEAIFRSDIKTLIHAGAPSNAS